MFVEADEALDIFSDGGCVVDRETRIVRIPPHVVEEAIASAARVACTLCGRDPKNDVVIEPGRVGFTNFSEGIRVIDVDDGRVPPVDQADIADIARLNDYLSEMDIVRRRGGRARTCRRQTAAVHNAEVQFLNTTKPVGIGPALGMDVQGDHRHGGGDRRRRGRAARAADRLHAASARSARSSCRETSPRSSSSAARWGIPDNILSMAMAGGSSPGDPRRHAGHAQRRGARRHHAGAAHRARRPVIYGSSTTAMDLKLADGHRRLAGDRADQRRGGAAGAAVPDPRASSPGCRRTPSSVTRRPVTRRPSPDSRQRWQAPT